MIRIPPKAMCHNCHVQTYRAWLQDCTPIFPQNGGELLSNETGLPLLSKIPIDPNLVRCGESGENFIQKFYESDTVKVFTELQAEVLRRIVDTKLE